VRSDIVRYLTHITGQEFGSNANKWDAWWKEKEEEFEFPPKTSGRKERAWCRGH
jgi:hypothetical protein